MPVKKNSSICFDTSKVGNLITAEKSSKFYNVIFYNMDTNIRSFRFIKLYKKSDHFMFLLDQILVNSHWELNLMWISNKKKFISKNWLGL